MSNGVDSYRRFLEGDEKGLEEIVRIYSDSLLLFIDQIVKNLDIAEDLMEDAFAALIVKRHKFREEASFKTYLYRIGRNKALNYLKKHRRLEEIPLHEMDEGSIPQEPLSVEDIVLRKEQQKELREAMNRLNNDYREVLYLLYFEEMSYEEIGKVLKKNNNQIKNLAYRSRQSLKEILKKEDFVYEEL